MVSSCYWLGDQRVASCGAERESQPSSVASGLSLFCPEDSTAPPGGKTQSLQPWCRAARPLTSGCLLIGESMCFNDTQRHTRTDVTHTNLGLLLSLCRGVDGVGVPSLPPGHWLLVQRKGSEFSVRSTTCEKAAKTDDRRVTLTFMSGVDSGRGLRLFFCSSVLRCCLGVEPPCSWQRGMMGSSGKAAASCGDHGAMMGALTGRDDLLSGVEAIAERERQRRREHHQVLLPPSGSGEEEPAPPSRLREFLLLEERWKSGAGLSIRELACLDWAWVRPL